MKTILLALLAFFIIPVLSFGQTNEKIANEAFVITRMANKFHVAPRPVNKVFSEDVFSAMLKKADEDRMFFTVNDIVRLGTYRNSIDIEIKQRKTNYLDLFINIYRQRLKQADSLLIEISKKPVDLYLPEKLTVAEDTLPPQSLAVMRVKLYKRLKANMLNELIDDLPGNFKSLTPAAQKKYIDSDEVSLQKRVTSALKRKVNFILQYPYGLPKFVGNIYCEVIASCYDPHTEFFPPEEKEKFESELGKQPFLFGFTIKTDKSGGVVIDKLQPGSPAFKGGQLKKGDKFIALQWEGGKPVNIEDISVNELAALMEESNHKQVVFTMKKADGSIIQVPLQKEQIANNNDEGKVKSFILKGAQTVGYIYLPAFYEDWEDSNNGLNGCANDVGREIIKLKEENIDGLILDLRSNGGGSAQEATELAGIFIDAGPVEQVKDRGEKIYTFKDVDRGTIYDGPLAILVNGYSASASELLAGTLQDYNRAVIIGSPTYGKATAQVVFPMDTTVTHENIDQIKTENYLKITVSKLYRITGSTAQFKGVQPDIVLPDMLDAYITREANAPFALRPDVINANKYYDAYPPLPLGALAAYVQTEIDTNKYLNTAKKYINYYKQQKQQDITLSVKAVLNDPYFEIKNDAATAENVKSQKFKVQNNQYEKTRLQADDNAKELNDEFSEQLATDPYVSVAYDVIAKLKTK